MQIRKIDNEGTFRSATPIFEDRTKRSPFLKAPIVDPRPSLFAFFCDLFRRGPNPFKASPMATEIDRRLKIEKRARLLGKFGNTSDNAATPLLASIHIALQRYWRSSVDRADTELDTLDGQLVMEKGHLENCRPKVIQANLDGQLRRIVDNVGPDIGPIAKECASSEYIIDKFRKQHNLSETTSWGKIVTRSDFTDLLGIMGVEFILNSLFFSASQKNGLIGGAGLAAQLSIAPLVLGAALGLSYQFMHPSSEGKGWLGKIGVPIFALAAIFYLLLLTLARYAGDKGDLEMFASASAAIRTEPFAGLFDLPALAYFFFSIAVIGAVFFKFVNSFGTFPGLWKRTVAATKSDQEFEAELSEILDATRKGTDGEVQRLDAVPDILQQTVVPIRELQMNFENVLDQYRNDVRDIRDSERLLVSVVATYVHSDSYGELSKGDGTYAAGHGDQMAHLDQRKGKFLADTNELLAWDEVSQASIDKCREAMITNGQTALKQVEETAKTLRLSHVEELARIKKI